MFNFAYKIRRTICSWIQSVNLHDDVIKWKHFPRYWRGPVNSPHKGQWCGALVFSLICVWINGWVNSREAGDLRRYRAHYYVTVMWIEFTQKSAQLDAHRTNMPEASPDGNRFPTSKTSRTWAFSQLLLLCGRHHRSPVFVKIMVNYLTHYDDVVMGAIASHITSLTIVYTTVYWDSDQSKHQSSASLAFVWGIHRGPVNSPHKGPVTRKMFPFDDVIMLANGRRSCYVRFVILIISYHDR